MVAYEIVDSIKEVVGILLLILGVVATFTGNWMFGLFQVFLGAWLFRLRIFPVRLYSYAAKQASPVESAKDAVAITLMTEGAKQITQGNYLVGGSLVFIGFVLMLLDKYVF